MLTVNLADVAAALVDDADDVSESDRPTSSEYAARLFAQFYGATDAEREDARGW